MNSNAIDTPADSAGPRVALALAAVYLIWGSTYLGIRFALEGGFTPFLLGGIRFTVAGGLMFAFLRWRGMRMPTPAQWRNAAALGVLLLLLGNGMVNLAEQSVSSGMAAVAVASAPLWMGVFSALRGEHPARMEWVGLGIGFLGVRRKRQGAHGEKEDRCRPEGHDPQRSQAGGVPPDPEGLAVVPHAGNASLSPGEPCSAGSAC